MENKKVKNKCKFCLIHDGCRRAIGLVMCNRCCQKYSYVCLLYLSHLKCCLASKGLSWGVKFLLNAEGSQVPSETSFFLLFSRGNVRIVTSVDRAAFFAAVSRLHSDLVSLNPRKSSIVPQRARLPEECTVFSIYYSLLTNNTMISFSVETVYMLADPFWVILLLLFSLSSCFFHCLFALITVPMSESHYGLTTFSPSGKLVQIEYATKAAEKGSAALGVKALDGVVIAAKKKTTSPLVDPSTIQKVFQLDDHVGCTYSGMGPDSRVLIDAARKSCQKYRLTYHEPIPVSQLVRKVSAVYQEFTQSGGVRPFGCSLLVSGVDSDGYHLYQLDPSGTFWAWKATAIGQGYSDSKAFLEKRYTDDVELEDAVHTALLTLKENFDGKMTSENIQVGVVSNEKFEILSMDQLRDYLDQI
eukprot:gene10108-7075_t